MKIQYQKIENGLEILRIWQDSGIIKVPEQIEGIPVIRIAPYTFSLHKDEEEKNASVYQTETGEEDDRFAQPEELCCGGMVREIHLPSTVQSIGNYALYESETFPWDRCNRADGERGIYRMPSGEGGD